jgi:class 3 adenylate cyclase
MARHISLFGGTVEKYAGDAIVAVFGVPRIHEDDAERAVRAAFAMQDSLAQLNPMFEQEYGAVLALRIGVATGEAVAATRDTDQLMVTGEVVNLAARLQTAADGIVISEETHRLVAPILESERLPALALKGFPAPVSSYRLLGIRVGETRTPRIPGLFSRSWDGIRRLLPSESRATPPPRRPGLHA